MNRTTSNCTHTAIKSKTHRAGFVAIIGRPNAGKSTLINALLNQKISIVSQKEQTTRSRIFGIISEENFQMIIMDTPGILSNHKNDLDWNLMGIVKTAIRNADCILVIIDASKKTH